MWTRISRFALLFTILAGFGCDDDKEGEADFGKVNTITLSVRGEKEEIAIDPFTTALLKGTSGSFLQTQGYAFPERTFVHFFLADDQFDLNKKYVVDQPGLFTFNVMVWSQAGGLYRANSDTDTLGEMEISELEVGNQSVLGDFPVQKLKARMTVNLTYNNPERPDLNGQTFNATVLMNVEK